MLAIASPVGVEGSTRQSRAISAQPWPLRVVERRLTLPNDSEFARHASDAIAPPQPPRLAHRQSPTRAPASTRSSPLCMALERAEHRPEPVELLGWL
jgi:hypothetical protein